MGVIPQLPTTHAHSTEVELLTRSVSAAGPLVMKLMARAGEPSPIKAQGHVGSPANVPPLKREEGAGQSPWLVELPVAEEIMPILTVDILKIKFVY